MSNKIKLLEEIYKSPTTGFQTALIYIKKQKKMVNQ